MAVVPEFEVTLPYFLSIFIYGASDSGKTVLASCAPDLDPKEISIVSNALFLDVEGGTVSLPTRGAGIIVEKFPKGEGQLIQTKEKLAEGIDYLKANKNRFTYAALDSLDRFQECAIDAIIKGKSHPRPEQQDWMDVLLMLQKLGRTVPTWGVHVIVTCHDNMARDSTDAVTKRMPLIQGSFKGKLSSYFDVVGYYEKTRNDTGKEIRLLHTKGSTDFFARSRLGNCLPDTILNPNIPAMIAEYHKNRDKRIKELQANTSIRVKILGAGA